jgi:hypothetical protein
MTTDINDPDARGWQAPKGCLGLACGTSATRRGGQSKKRLPSIEASRSSMQFFAASLGVCLRSHRNQSVGRRSTGQQCASVKKKYSTHRPKSQEHLQRGVYPPEVATVVAGLPVLADRPGRPARFRRIEGIGRSQTGDYCGDATYRGCTLQRAMSSLTSAFPKTRGSRAGGRLPVMGMLPGL